MYIKEKNVQERLKGVPLEKRSYIYNASIILEFLAKTFMPTRYFFAEGFEAPVGQIDDGDFKAISRDKNLSMKELYELYRLFREEKDYTIEIESRYTFSVIIKHLRLYANGWEFKVYRVGKAQIWHVGPLCMRKDVPFEIREQFSHPEKIENQEIVEADPVTNDEEEEEEVEQFNQKETIEKVKKFVEAKFDLPEGGMVEVNYDLPEEFVVEDEPLPPITGPTGPSGGF